MKKGNEKRKRKKEMKKKREKKTFLPCMIGNRKEKGKEKRNIIHSLCKKKENGKKRNVYPQKVKQYGCTFLVEISLHFHPNWTENKCGISWFLFFSVVINKQLPPILFSFILSHP